MLAGLVAMRRYVELTWSLRRQLYAQYLELAFVTPYQSYSRPGRVELPSQEIDKVLVCSAVDRRRGDAYLQMVANRTGELVATRARLHLYLQDQVLSVPMKPRHRAGQVSNAAP